MIDGQPKPWLQLLREFRSYEAYRTPSGGWEEEALGATLEAKNLAARYLLMNEDVLASAIQTVQNLQPPNVETPLVPEEFTPGESFAVYWGRRADAEKRRADKEQRRADDLAHRYEEANRHAKLQSQQLQQALEREQQQVARRRQRGHDDDDIAADLGYTPDEFQLRHPPATN